MASGLEHHTIGILHAHGEFAGQQFERFWSMDIGGPKCMDRHGNRQLQP